MDDAKLRPHALIIGASSGVGAACAVRLSLTHNITGISRRGVLPEGIPKHLSLAMPCDATSASSLKACVEEAVATFGKLSLVVVSAGAQLIKPVRNVKEQEVLDLLTTNVGIPFFAASLFASQRISNPDAVLCLISSVSSIRAEPGIVLYGATKGATESMVSGLAKELAPRRVVGVSPGWLNTPMTQAYSHVYTDEFIGKLADQSPLGLATTADIVDAVAFLSSPYARKITGQILVVDGGASL